MPTNTAIAERLPRSTGGFKSGVQWPIRASYRMPAAKMAYRLISPRPDADTQAHARQKWAHPDMIYEVAVVLQGGNWPYKYEIVAAPAGATIGSYYDVDQKGLLNQYGNVSWQPTASSGSHTFEILVTDCNGDTFTVTWSVTIDASKFIFIQDGYAGTKVGTITQPLEDWSDWYKNDADDATYLGKIIVFRGGNYTLVGDTVHAAPNAALKSTTKSGQLIGFPGEVATINCGSGKIQTATALHDLYISHLRWVNARNDILNPHYFWLTNKCDRSTFFKNHFDGMSYGTGAAAGQDNCGPIFYADLSPGVHHEYAAIRDNLFEGINTHNGGLGNGHYWDAYQMDYLVAEGNVSKDSYTTYGHWPKATSSFITVRNNDVFDNCQGAGCVLGISDGNDTVPHDYEVCWNNFRVPVIQASPVFEVAMDDGWLGQYYNIWVYRNTFIGGYVLVRFAGLDPYYFDANAILTNNLGLYNTSLITATIPSLASTSAAAFDADGIPTDPTKRFFVGHEVY